jgi:hypothetical protein
LRGSVARRASTGGAPWARLTFSNRRPSVDEQVAGGVRHHDPELGLAADGGSTLA